MSQAGSSWGPLLPRFIAIALAVGATYWGGLLLLAFGPAVLLSPFGGGYVVLVGYVVRAVIFPPFGIRQVIWIASLVVQGSCLCLGLASFGIKPEALLWWAAATLGSIVALVAELADIEAEPHPIPSNPSESTSGRNDRPSFTLLRCHSF